MTSDQEAAMDEAMPLIAPPDGHPGVGPPKRKGAHFLVVPALFCVQLSFSASSVIQSNMLRTVTIDAVVFTFLRCVLSAMLLLLIAAASREGLIVPTGADVGSLLLIGICGMYFGQLFLLLALQHISVLNASVISALQPVSTMCVGHLIGMELITLRTRSGQFKVLGLLLAVGGGTTIVMSQASGESKVPGDWLLGNTFAILFCLGNGCYPLVQKHMLNERRLSPLNITAWGMLSGACVIGITLPVSHFEREDWQLPLRAVGVLLYTTLIASALAYTLVTWAIANSSPVFVIGFSPLQLVLTASFAAIFLGDTVELPEVVGMLAVCVGLWILGASRVLEEAQS
jgi:drug/metabolite transporter (DMT)-like permease